MTADKEKMLSEMRALAERWRAKVQTHYDHSQERIYCSRCAEELERLANEMEGKNA